MAPGLGTFDIEIDRHFSPGQIRLFFQELSLEPLGPIQVAGRDCARLRAVLRPGARLWPHWLPREATSYEFHVDVERGVLLSIISLRADQVFDVCEVIDVTFDEPLESSLFKYEPAPGEQVGPKIPVVEHLTLAAAVARMPFKVLVPTRLPVPDHSPIDVMYHPPRRHQRWPHLALMYRGSESYKFLSINESASADPNINELDWELVPNDKAFQKNLRVANPHELGGMKIAAFEQEGTHVTIVSDLGQEELITLAMSLIPAPTGTLI